MSLSEVQRGVFSEQGIVRLMGVFSEADAACMVDRIWNLLEERGGVRRDAPATWPQGQPTGFQSLTRCGAFNPIRGPKLIDAIDTLLGRDGWKSTETWGAPLVTFPDPGGTWEVPREQWHLDFPARGGRLPGIRLLAFIARVQPRGGGTLVATGSQRLVERLVRAGLAREGHSAQVRELLSAAHPWFHGLWLDDGEGRAGRFMEASEVLDGVAVHIEELTGAPGDLVLMHPWTFHAPAPNCGTTPRLMVSHSVFARET